MKVQGGNHPINVDPRLTSAAGAANDATKEVPKADPAAKLSVSKSAASLSGVREELERIPEIRAEKVAQIKAEVEAGRYQRPAADIAEKMITGSLQESLYQ